MIVLPAYAKLNLALEVTERTRGGLHTLASVIVRIDWHDLVGVEPATPAPDGRDGDASRNLGVALQLSGSFSAVPRGEDNIAARAALLTARLARIPPPSLWLHKRIPAAAGLGGGSADAASVITAMRASLGGVGAAELRAAAATLGSDVPAMLAGGAQLVGGTGEVLEPLPTPRLHIVVVHAAPASTAAAYGAVQAGELRSDGRAAALAAQLRRGVPPETSLFGSALEAPALRVNPQLAHHVAAIRERWWTVPWHLTGSGGALFAVTQDAAASRQLAATLAEAGYTARACRTIGI